MNEEQCMCMSCVEKEKKVQIKEQLVKSIKNAYYNYDECAYQNLRNRVEREMYMNYEMEDCKFEIPKECKMIIFDYDETLHCRENRLFNENIRKIIDYLSTKKVIMAVASLSRVLHHEFIRHDLNGIFHYVIYVKGGDIIYTKYTMLKDLLGETQIDASNILFFDNRLYHCVEANMLGIKSIQVNSNTGLTMDDIMRGIELFDNEI